MELTSYLSGLSSQKFSLKIFHIFFPKKTCSENNSYIFSKENFSYTSRNGTLRFSAHALKIEKIHTKKISYIFSKEGFPYISGNGNPKKVSYILQNGNSEKKFLILYFRKGKPRKNVLHFRK